MTEQTPMPTATTAITSLSMNKIDDMHLHLRDGDALTRTVSDSCLHTARAIIMPNLVPPVTQIKHAEDYRQRIMDAAAPASSIGSDSQTSTTSSPVAKQAHAPATQAPAFEPLMTMYLTDDTDAALIKAASAHPHIHAFKLYPAGATTNSASGITDFNKLGPILEALQEQQMPLCIHGEVTDADIDIFDREAMFIDKYLSHWLQDFPDLKVILEHISTRHAVEFIESCDNNNTQIAATITAHHLLANRNDMLVGGVKPHYYCLPILKRGSDQHALQAAALSGDSRFFAGSDSAPHTKNKKQSACGCAGVYTGFATLSYYAEFFERANAIDKLEDFCCRFGSEFYGLANHVHSDERHTKQQIELIKRSWTIPTSLPFQNEEIIPFMAGETLQWQVKS